MEIKKGNKRIVFVFGDFVLKLAMIKRPYWAAFPPRYPFSRKADGKMFREKGNKVSYAFTPLYIGFILNWREFVYYQKIKNPFLAPTMFSFFGIINIQRRRQMLAEPEWYAVLSEPKSELAKIIDDEGRKLLSWRDGQIFDHALFNWQNYGWDRSGHLSLVDYGDKVIFDFLEKHGQELYEKFVKKP